MLPGNISSLSPPDCDPVSLNSINVAVPYLFFFSFPVALLFNGVAAWVSLHLHSTSTFIVYLKNLVAADLLMTLTLPSVAASMLPEAEDVLRAFVCRFSGVIFYCCLYTSIALMGLISLDRFFKIVRPCGKVIGQNVVFSIVMCASVWVVMFGVTAIPTIALTNQYPVNVTGDYCMSMKSSAGLTVHNFVVLFMEILFWFVTILIVFCYICITLKVLQSFRNSGSNNSHGKKRTKLRVFLILFVFSVCFVPLHIMRIPFTLYQVLNTDVCTPMWVFVVHNLALWLSTTNSCLDPLLYIFLCREYREKMVDMMKAGGICVENEDVSK